MNKPKITASLTRAFGMAGLKLKKHSPEILLVTGIVGGVASAVMACKASTKLNPVLEDSKAKIEAIKTTVEEAEEGYYEPKDISKAIGTVYAQTGLELVKLYGPAIAVGVASIGCVLASRNIVHKRNIALAAAYATVDSSFKDYRSRVIERFGKELDKELKYNIKTKEVEEIVKDEDGHEKVVKSTVQTATINPESEYARFFDEFCSGWTRCPEDNLRFLRMQQSYANKKLQSQGYLFLNEVYEMLGIPRTKAGQIVGWLYTKDNSGPSDNFIDFGIYDLYDEKKRDFVNGYEQSILLDFNVVPILEYI